VLLREIAKQHRGVLAAGKLLERPSPESDGATMVLLAIGISQSSSAECSTWICVPRLAAWRRRCAMSG
jgi:hypothetical protein